MSNFKYKFQMYKSLQQNIPNIYAEAKKAGEEIGIGSDLKGKFGLTGAISGCPAPLREDVMKSTADWDKKVIPLAVLVDELREIIKDVYGDGYDCAPTSTCEAGLWVSYEALMTPPSLGRGDNYRSCYIAPFEKHMHHQGGYGRPFPAKYKDLFADRGSTSGEMGFYGKRLNNFDLVIAKLAGANYDTHGIKYWPVPLLTEVNPQESIKEMKKIAAIHAERLTGFASLAYDTAGYGYGVKDEDGTPVMQKLMAELAKEYNVPYLQDNAWGVPFIGTDIRKTGADIMVYAMDKAAGAATSGLVIGKEDVMVQVRRAMGMHGDRYGTTGSYGKAAFVTFDAGKEAIASQIQALKILRDKPEILTKPVDDLYEIVVAEFAQIHPKLRDCFDISKSYNSTAIEVNYEKSWTGGKMGIPIFSIEDMYANSNIFQTGMAQMGVIPTIAYDGNIFISPGLATTDEYGNLLPEPTQKAVRGLVKLIEITCKYAGLI